MKQYAIFCIAATLLLMSCKKTIPFLTGSNLQSTFITVDGSSAYTLQTPKGAIIKIDSNSFDVPADSKVKIEVKEAYSEKDILLAGLSTVSNGRLLQSGGMIYFNATMDGKVVSVVKPIHISIPAKDYNTSMQLFKGEVQKDNSINWVDPQPLDSQATKPSAVIVPDSSKTDSTTVDTARESDGIAYMDSAAAPCGYDTIYTAVPDTAMKIVPADTTTYDTAQAYIPQASVYDFNISDNGWYNIDCFIDANINMVTMVHLSAVLNNVPDDVKNMEVYIAIPSRKLLSDERGNNGNAYTFYDANDDSIRLILNDDAFIFAVGTNEDKAYYGLTKFTVKEQQSINVSIHESTKAAIMQALLNNKLDSTKIDPDVPEIVNYSTPAYNDTDTTSVNIQPDTTKQKMQMEIVPDDCRARIY